AGDCAQEGDPVPDLLPPVSAVTLDLVVREASEGVHVAPRDVIEHAVVEVGIDPPRLGCTHPVGEPAGAENGDALPDRARPDDPSHEGPYLAAASRGR